MTIYKGVVTDLSWWGVQSNLTLDFPFHLPTPEVTLVTDASTLGLGAHLGEMEIRGFWSPEEQSFHINLLELRAIQLALKAFVISLKGRPMQVL